MPHSTMPHQTMSPHISFASTVPATPLMKTKSLPSDAFCDAYPPGSAVSSRWSAPVPASSYWATGMPSPSTSVSTLPSSAGPFTPPQYFASMPPASEPRLPSSTRSHTHGLPTTSPKPNIHHLLHPTPGFPARLTWHVMVDWRSAVVAAQPAPGSSRRSLPKPQPIPWETSVTPQPLQTIQVVIADLPWGITIHASVPAHGITFSDFLHGVWHTLKEKVTNEEWARTTLQQRRMAEASLDRRARRQTDEATMKSELNAGVRRGDYLHGKVFAGVVVHPNGSWQLLVC